MENAITKTRLLRDAKICLVFVVLCCLFFCSCQEQATSKTSYKKERLVAAENMRLKKQCNELQLQIEDYKAQLDKCLSEKKSLEGKTSKNIKSMMEGILGRAVEENRKLKEQNEQLKLQLEQLTEQATEQKQPRTQAPN